MENVNPEFRFKKPSEIFTANTLLTEGDKEFCGYAGALGIAFSVICIGQLIYITENLVWQVIPFFMVFIYSSIAFTMLVRKSDSAALLIVIGAVIVFIYLVSLILFFLIYGIFIFSLVQGILFFYMILIPIVMKYLNMPQKLQRYQAEKKHDEMFWNQKI